MFQITGMYEGFWRERKTNNPQSRVLCRGIRWYDNGVVNASVVRFRRYFPGLVAYRTKRIKRYHLDFYTLSVLIERDENARRWSAITPFFFCDLRLVDGREDHGSGVGHTMSVMCVPYTETTRKYVR